MNPTKFSDQPWHSCVTQHQMHQHRSQHGVYFKPEFPSMPSYFASHLEPYTESSNPPRLPCHPQRIATKLLGLSASRLKLVPKLCRSQSF